MAWVKRTPPQEPVPEETPAPSAADIAAETPLPAADASAQTAQSAENAGTAESSRYTKSGRRRGQRRGVAVLGLVMLLFAFIGVVATVWGGVYVIKRTRDTSYLKEDMYYTLLPLMQYAPVAFDSPDDSKQDALIQAALYQITNREWIRQQQDSEYVSPYEVDEYGRTAVPIADVTAAYNELFGTDTIPYCHTFGDDAGTYFTYEYDAENQLYYVPYSSTSSAYQPVIDTIQRAGSTYRVRVGYVHLQDVVIDDHGNEVVSVDNATYFQIYTVERLEDDRFVIRAVADEADGRGK